jgi:hypothetical protein
VSRPNGRTTAHASGGTDCSLPLWRRGFTPHELGAMFFTCQQVRSLEHEKRQLVTDLERADRERSHAERQAAFYRSQLSLESRLGLMLARIAVTPGSLR